MKDSSSRGSRLCLAVVCALATLATRSVRAEAPPASKGFQLALRSGVALPFGNVTDQTAMSDALGPQLPFLVDLGAKPTRALFVGAFLGGAVGDTAGAVRSACSTLGVSCTGLGFRGGLQVHYHLRPDEKLNPWIGYGIGYEIGGSQGSTGTNRVKNTLRGLEPAHVLAGLDLRVDEFFGAGPFLDAAVGQYSFAQSATNAGGYVVTRGGSVEDGGLHLWLILGVRAVLFP